MTHTSHNRSRDRCGCDGALSLHTVQSSRARIAAVAALGCVRINGAALRELQQDPNFRGGLDNCQGLCE
eukprot:13730360-Alexandrium_andersonii.AAC.1